MTSETETLRPSAIERSAASIRMSWPSISLNRTTYGTDSFPSIPVSSSYTDTAMRYICSATLHDCSGAVNRGLGVDLGDTVADRLQLAVERLGITSLTARKAVKANTANWSRWWRGRVVPDTAKLAEIATRLGVSYEWLATGAGEWRQPPSAGSAAAAYREMAKWAIEQAERHEAASIVAETVGQALLANRQGEAKALAPAPQKRRSGS